MPRAKRMDFRMTTPCPNCPFRSDVRPYLNPGRAEIIALELEHKTFACHKTTGVQGKQPRDAQGRFVKMVQAHCAGALILMHKSDRQGDLQQVAERLGLYDPTALDMDAPVYGTFQEFITAQQGRYKPRKRRRVWYA